jgi:hypothetical protein
MTKLCKIKKCLNENMMSSIKSPLFKLRANGSFVNTMMKLMRKFKSLSSYIMPTGSNTLLSLLGPENGGSTLLRNVPSRRGNNPRRLEFSSIAP